MTLLFALITLVALLLASLALVRSVDTSSILMGNIGFKQDATVTADQATRQALQWLDANKTVLNTDSAANGYYASTKEDGTATNPPVDATGQQIATSTRQLIDWDGDSCGAFSGTFTTCLTGLHPVGVTLSGANSASYVVFRLCSQAGDYSDSGYAGTCAKPLVSSAAGASMKGDLSYPKSTRLTGNSGPFYRVVVRVRGARNTTSFTETIVHF